MKRLILAFAVGAALSACTSQSVPEPPSVPSSTVTATTTTMATTPTPEPFYAFDYEANPERKAKISAITREFGLLVLEEAGKRGGWGVFDTFCATDGLSRSGWTSQGYTPQPGDECSTQHNPQYGGPSIQISTTYIVRGDDQRDFVRLIINTPDCWVQVHHFASNGVRRIGTDFADQTTSNASTEQEAQQIDARAIACIQTMRPER